MKKAQKIKSPQLDRLIADSKQVTVDLLALRREVSSKVYASAQDCRYSPATGRAQIVSDKLREMGDEMHELWAQAAGLREPEPSPRERTSDLALTNGTLWLTGGR